MLVYETTHGRSLRPLYRWAVGSAWAMILAGSLSVSACSSASDDAAFTSSGAETHGVNDDEPDAGGTAGAGSDDGLPGGEDSSGGPDDDGDNTGDEPPSPPPPNGEDDGTFAGCPQPLPGSWVFCEDFEKIDDPSEVVLDYQDLDGAFALVDGIGASGDHSMEVRYSEAEEAAGWMVVSFGDSPIEVEGRPSYSQDDSFQEIYWRLRVKMEPGWPDIGPGSLSRAIAFADADWSEAAVARLRSAGPDVVLEGAPSTCVQGSEVACTGFEDTSGLEPLGPLVGETPLFSQPESGRWHCVEGRLLLNTPGQSDGVFEFWVDEELQGSREDLDLRGSWTEYAINAVVVENLWPGGAPAPLHRWIDDVVVSTEPIGCLPGPAGHLGLTRPNQRVRQRGSSGPHLIRT